MIRRKAKTDVFVHCKYDKLELIKKLKPNPKNPNTHPPSQVKLLGSLLRQFGWRAPITVSRQSGMIVRGHGRYEAALNIHQVRAPIDVQSYSSPEEEHADMVADNKIPELAKIDSKLLADLLHEINQSDFDMVFTGYSETEIKKMLDKDTYEKFKDQAQYESESYQIMMECDDEDHQLELLEEFEKRGLVCKAIVL